MKDEQRREGEEKHLSKDVAESVEVLAKDGLAYFEERIQKRLKKAVAATSSREPLPSIPDLEEKTIVRRAPLAARR